MQCFHFSEQRFPRISLNKVPIISVQHTKECHGCFDWLHPKTISIKNSYYDRKVRESLEIDMAVVKYGQEKVLNRDNGNFVKTNAWKPLFRKMKTLH